MNKKLNTLLSDFVVEYHKLQNLHWYVKGSDFFQAHVQLENYYDEVNAGIDDIAELILQNDGQPLASLKSFLGESGIKELPEEYIDSKKVFEIVLSDFEYLLKEVKDVKGEADEQGNDLVSAKMDEYIAGFSKSIWMIKQHNM